MSNITQRLRLRQRFETAKKRTTSLKAWEVPKEPSTFAPPGVWANIDNDVTPVERRTWGFWSLIGYWMSDTLNAQSWSGASAIIAVGLTWREALVCLILGTTIIAIPMCLNGAIGARLRVPYPIAARSSFGYYFSRLPIVIRCITALFWHAIQTYAGSTAMTQCIRAIWPSYLDIPNHIPESMGITTQQMCSHFIFWIVQFPILMIPPHKLTKFFLFKAVYVVTAIIATVIGVCVKAGGSGEIWNQQPRVTGTERSWLILSGMMSLAGGWATMATNIPDFTRYLKSDKSFWLQAALVPVLCTFVGVMGIVATSASYVLYGEYIWDPVALAAEWDGAGGRAAAFFVGFAWVVAQIGVNVSANVVSASNDLVTLFPRWITLRRGAIIVTVIGAWVMVPWKIVHSAQSLINFMAALAIFLAPIAAMLSADYWIVKRQRIDVPALYRPHDRYHYWHGANWRSVVALLVSLGPNMPGLCKAVNDSLEIGGASRIYAMNYIWGYMSALVVYSVLSYVFPAPGTFIIRPITEGVTGGEMDVEEGKGGVVTKLDEEKGY